jgi:hypothetical protein
MDQLLFIRDRELVSTDIFMDQVDVFSGGLKVKECISKNDVRIGTLLGGVCFCIFIGVPFIYDAFVLQLSFIDLCSSCAEI